MDNTIANDVIESYKESGNVFVPRNITGTTELAGYPRFAVENIDIDIVNAPTHEFVTLWMVILSGARQ